MGIGGLIRKRMAAWASCSAAELVDVAGKVKKANSSEAIIPILTATGHMVSVQSKYGSA